MRTYDLSPLHRSSIGFDHYVKLLERVSNKTESAGYPPYNIERVSEEDYQITLAVAGFTQDDIDVQVHENELTITASKPENDAPREFLHQGIAARAFERQFHIAEHVIVTGASLENGLLNIALKRELPEAKKPRKIAINANSRDNVQILKDTNAA